MTLKRPALDPSTVEARSTSGYPEPFRSRVLPREKRAIGDALGLTKIGVNLTTLLPGKESSMRHFHAREDELLYVVEGEVVLKTDQASRFSPRARARVSRLARRTATTSSTAAIDRLVTSRSATAIRRIRPSTPTSISLTARARMAAPSSRTRTGPPTECGAGAR